MGQTTKEIELFLQRLDEAFTKFHSQAPEIHGVIKTDLTQDETCEETKD